jgi:hypothetical protein
MDFGKAFGFQFEDSDWLKKIGIGALLLIIPLLGALWVAGWSLEITKRVIRRDPAPLADWEDFGGYLVRGFQVFIIGFVYALPIILISTCISVLFPSVFDPGSSGEDVSAAIWVVVVCVNCLSLLYGILLAFVIPAALGNFADKEQFGAAFHFGEVLSLVRAAPMAYLLALIGNLLAGFIAMLGIILCFIGVVLTNAYAQSVIGHLNGQAYNEARSKLVLEPVEA